MMTFKQQSDIFLATIGNRKREPVKQATLLAYKSLLNRWVLPVLGDVLIADIQNRTVKPLVEVLSKAGKSPQTITSVIGVIKAVVKSVTDENGNQTYPRTWNHEFMDVPTIQAQKAPIATAKAIQQALDRANSQDTALYALLAGTGIRIGEALALKVGPDNQKDSFWLPESGTLIIRSTVSKGKIQYSPKTEAGNREIDLSPDLNDYLCQVFLRKNLTSNTSLLFPNRNGGVANDQTGYRHLEAAGIPGFHSLRRFRVTHLRKQQVPEGLVQAWVGHRGASITDRYDKISLDTDARRLWAQKAGLGFQLQVAV